MRIAVGADHGGSRIRNCLKEYLAAKKLPIVDFGSRKDESCDYPDFAFAVAESVKKGNADLGILVCRTGLGMCVAANKVKGVRAVLLTDKRAARVARAHNNANVICFSGRCPEKRAVEMLDAFLKARFEGGRHQRRLDKIARYESKAGS